jgi:hypothetical protein
MAVLMERPQDIVTAACERMTVGDYRLVPRDFRKGRTERETYFNLFLAREGALSRNPVVQGLFFMGRGEYIRPWIEFRFEPRAAFPDGGEVDLDERGLTGDVFALLGSLIPPGGSMMVIYGAESHPFAAETEKGLKRKFPPQATPIGYRLWKAGFRWYKDWYFPEGWLEGAMKLQATRPLGDDIRLLREAQAKKELEGFVSEMRRRSVPDPEASRALARAEEILSGLESNAPPR